MQFRFEQDAYLVFYPPEGEIDAGTQRLTIYDEREEFGDPAWPVTPALDSQSTTLSVEALDGDSDLTVDDGSGFVVGEGYLLTDLLGFVSRVKLVGVGALNLYCDQRLVRDAGIASTVKGYALRYTLDAANTGVVKRNIRMAWTYEVNGVPVFHDEWFDIVRVPFHFVITEDDLEKHDSTFGESAGRYRRWLSLVPGAIDDAWAWIEGQGLKGDRILAARKLCKEAVALFTLAKYYRDEMEKAKDFRELAIGRLQNALSSFRPYDQNDDGRVNSGEETVGSHGAWGVH